jgi:hypothetical protein
MLIFHIFTSYTVIRGEDTFGPLPLDDLDKFMKPIRMVESDGPNSLKPNQNGLHNTSPSTTVSTVTNHSFPGRRTGRKSKKHTHCIGSQEVEQAQNPKKPRVIWTDELQKEFLEAYNKLVAAGEGNEVNHWHDLRYFFGLS